MTNLKSNATNLIKGMIVGAMFTTSTTIYVIVTLIARGIVNNWLNEVNSINYQLQMITDSAAREYAEIVYQTVASGTTPYFIGYAIIITLVAVIAYRIWNS